MIIDHISRAELYYRISKNLKAGLQFLQQTDFTSLTPQKIIIDGDEFFAMVQEYETQKAEENVPEAHKK